MQLIYRFADRRIGADRQPIHHVRMARKAAQLLPGRSVPDPDAEIVVDLAAIFHHGLVVAEPRRPDLTIRAMASGAVTMAFFALAVLGGPGDGDGKRGEGIICTAEGA